VIVRGLERADLAALRAIFNGQVAYGAWTAEEVEGLWLDHAHGDRGRVAERDGRVVGGVGSVLAPPWLYVFPLVAEDVDAATRLVQVVTAQATADVRTLRVSVRPGEEPKRAALLAAGWVPSIEFIDLVHDLRGGRGGGLASELTRVAHADIVRGPAHALHDRVFAEIPNTAPLDDADFDHMLDGPMCWPAATAVWCDAEGRPQGFVFAQRGEDYGVIDAIGVDPAQRGRGLARHMVEDVLARARAAGLAEVRCTIASTNTASLALHRAAGFTDRARKQLYDYPRDR
jgi:ribosomal protein S18 acetylase RimI-like enzyme